MHVQPRHVEIVRQTIENGHRIETLLLDDENKEHQKYIPRYLELFKKATPLLKTRSSAGLPKDIHYTRIFS